MSTTPQKLESEISTMKRKTAHLEENIRIINYAYT
jgi:hypothetical protein